MKRTLATFLIVISLAAAGCTTTVAVKPPKPHPKAVWVEGHWERHGFHRAWIPGHWR